MTGNRVDQVNVPDVLRDLRRRVRALEALKPAGTLYVDDRILAADTATLTFDSFPSDLALLRLAYSACTVEGVTADIGVGTLLYTDPPEPSADWAWNIDVPNPTGGQGQLIQSAYSDQVGGYGFIPPYAGANVFAVGEIAFPDYTLTAGDSESYTGYGMSVLGVPGGDPPDVWTVGGYRQNSGPITKIVLQVFDIADTGLTTPLTYKAQSRFTLYGYPAS